MINMRDFLEKGNAKKRRKKLRLYTRPNIPAIVRAERSLLLAYADTE